MGYCIGIEDLEYRSGENNNDCKTTTDEMAKLSPTVSVYG